MEQPQEQAVPLPTVAPETEAPGEEEVAPTKSVKNFWERLDEVFNQNTQLRERMEELVEQFPEFQRTQGPFKSFLFQPERIALSSNDDVTPYPQTVADPSYVPNTVVGHYPSEKFSSFRIRLKRPLRNVKSIQLLSAVIPNAIQNIPDDQVFFLYYKIRSVANADLGAWDNATTYFGGDIVSYLGTSYVAIYNNQFQNLNVQPDVSPTFWQPIQLPVDTTRPNYYDLNPNQIKYVYLSPTFSFPYDALAAGDQLAFNRTFEDYDDVVNSLNYILTQPLLFNNAGGDITFAFNAALNKIILIPNPANIAAGNYYLPCGYDDPNVTEFFTSPTQLVTGLPGQLYNIVLIKQKTPLNVRLGFTWNGIYPNPYTIADPWSDINLMGSLWWYMRASDPGFFAGLIPPWTQNQITFNSYGDLVNTSCVRLYADFAFASTQDSLGSSSPVNTATADGLLSIVPVNTNNLGVAFYQNNFNNALTKIPQNIAEIGITMLNDQGLPYYLPNSATVLLELAIDYSS